MALTVAATLTVPDSWRALASGSVGHYALTPAGWRAILDRAGG